MPMIERRCSSSAPTSAIDTLCPWAMRSLRLLTTCRLSLRDIASGIEISTCKMPTCMAQPRRGRLQRPLELLPHVRLEDVADLDVVVVGELDAALETRLDFLDVVLDPAERFDREVLGDDDAAAGEADLAAALHVAVGDEAAGNVAELGHLE